MLRLLDGVRVLDFTSVLSGPACTNGLAKLGADVIKVEPLTGDVMRGMGPPSVGDLSPHFMQINRGKRSLSLDLRDPKAVQACRRVAATADVVVENFRPGVMDKLGLGYEALAADNPDLIFASISGFGPDGPWASMRAYDSMIQALGGFMAVQGGSGEPQLIQCAIADKVSGRAAHEAILAALFARERGQGGRRISISMLDAFISFMMEDSMRNHTLLDHPGDPHPVNAHVKFRTKDGWISFLFVRIEEYHDLFRACGRPDLAEDPRFTDRGTLRRNFAAWMAEVQDLVGRLDTAEVVEMARARALPIAPVLSPGEMFEFEQVRHNGVFLEREMGAGVGRVRYVNGPWRFDGEAPGDLADPPHLGEHSLAILREAGLSETEIGDLGRLGALGAWRPEPAS